MNRWTYILFIWITSTSLSNTAESEFDPEFKAIPLGFSSLLVTWKSNPNNNQIPILYDFSYQEIHSTDIGEERRTWRSAQAADTQIKLNDLKEDTKYRIKVTDEKNDRRYFFEARTGVVDFSIPFKPDFKYNFERNDDQRFRIKITWLPCGKNGNCGDEKAGSSFYVKYRRVGESTFHQKKEYYEDYIYLLDCVPGAKYEFIVGSMNLPFDSESDVREIDVPPGEKL